MPDNLAISPVTRTKAQARAGYDRMSPWYDLLSGSSERKHREAGLALLQAGEGEIILEIGFGTGHSLIELARSVGPSGHIYGLDISAGMRQAAEGRLRAAGLSDRATLTCGDAAHLPYGDDFFDAVCTSFTLELFDTPEIPTVLQECRRVLKTGGRLGVVAMVKGDKPGLMERLYEWFHRRFPTYVDCRPIYVSRSVAEAGFTLQAVSRRSMWGLPVEVVLARK